MEQALKVLGIEKNEALMVGDNYDTDILAGINAGMHTLLVHTGVTTVEKLTEYEVQPTQVVHNLTEWIEDVRKLFQTLEQLFLIFAGGPIGVG